MVQRKEENTNPNEGGIAQVLALANKVMRRHCVAGFGVDAPYLAVTRYLCVEKVWPYILDASTGARGKSTSKES